MADEHDVRCVGIHGAEHVVEQRAQRFSASLDFGGRDQVAAVIDVHNGFDVEDRGDGGGCAADASAAL
jgi:hypothetical protein